MATAACHRTSTSSSCEAWQSVQVAYIATAEGMQVLAHIGLALVLVDTFGDIAKQGGAGGEVVDIVETLVRRRLHRRQHLRFHHPRLRHRNGPGGTGYRGCCRTFARSPG